MSDIMDLLKNADKKTLQTSMARVRDFFDTPQGKKMLENLKKGGPPSKALEELTPKGLPKETQNAIIKELTANPALIKSLAALIEKK